MKTENGYSIIFNEENPGWQKTPEDTIMYLRSLETLANYKLREKGYLLLKDVYEMMDIPLTRESFVVGWHNDEDTFVDFGVPYYCYICSELNSIKLTFNVDENLLDFFESEKGE